MLARRNADAEFAALRAGVALLDATPQGALDLRLLLALHRRLLPPSHPYRGRFRDCAAVIRLAGAGHWPLPPPGAALRQTQDVLDWLNGAPAEPAGRDLLAAEAMSRLTAAHPFLDGNGRVALTVATWLLVRTGYTLRADPIRYCRERKPEQYRALAANDRLPPGSRPAAAWAGFFAGLVRACFDAPAAHA